MLRYALKRLQLSIDIKYMNIVTKRCLFTLGEQKTEWIKKDREEESIIGPHNHACSNLI